MFFNSSIGIEINDSQINIVYLKGSLKGVNPAAASSCRLDAGRSRQERKSDTISFINDFIREEKITSADIFLGIPADAYIMRQIGFPLAVKENLRATLTYEIEKYIPLSAEDVYFDYHIIKESKEEETLTLLLVAVKKDVFTYYLDIADQIDKGVSGIGVIAAGLANAFLYDQESSPSPVILLCATTSGYDAVVVKEGAMIYTKAIDITETSGKESAYVGEQLARLKDNFCGDDETAHVVLYGIDGLDDPYKRLSENFSNISSGSFPPPIQNEQFLSAFGLALKGISDVPVELNLMPVRLRKKPNKTGRYAMVILAGFLVLAGMIWAGSHLVVQRKILDNLDTELAQLRKQAAVVEQVQAETRQYKESIQYIQSLRPGGAYAIEVAEELSNIIPADAWLTELKLVGTEMSLYGKSESASALIALLEDSLLFEDVEFISAIRKDRDGKEIFRIRCKVNDGK